MSIDNNIFLDYLQICCGHYFAESITFKEDQQHEAIFFIFEKLQSVLPSGCRLTSSSSDRVARYSHSYTIVDTLDNKIAMIACSSPSEGVTVQISGKKAELCRSIVESDFFSHSSVYPQRYDLAIDVLEDELPFLDFANRINSIATDECRMSTSTVGDWMNEKNGRTLYLGKRKGSYNIVRWYEKSLERSLFDCSKFNRLEFEYHPTNAKNNKQHRYDVKKDLLELFSSGSLDIFRYSKVSVLILNYLKGLDMTVLPRSQRVVHNSQKSASWALNQNLKSLQWMVDQGHDLNDIICRISSMRESGSSFDSTIKFVEELEPKTN